MTASCLDRTLISKSVEGTGANVTLLVQALTPLCPKPTPPVEVAANHIVTISIGYVCGFLPWGFIALFDFISAKWKTVRKTRRLGYFHLGASVAPMGFVIAYAVLQALSGDFKEMMTAVIAVALTLHHLNLTVWGLVQLREYVAWCEETLQCIKAMQPKDWIRMFNRSDEDDDEESIDLDDALMVNEEIVDNEFTGRDVSVSYEFSSGAMKVSNPEVCTIRWAAAFLCSVGHAWKSLGNRPLPARLAYFIESSMCYVDASNSGVPPNSLRYLSRTTVVSESKCGAFGSTICAPMACGANPFRPIEFEFDNILSSYPTRNESMDENLVKCNRMNARLEVVEYLLTARILGPQRLRAIAAQCSQNRGAFQCTQQFTDALDLLQYQLGIEEPIHISDVHWFWKHAMASCLSDQSNAFTFQTSIEADNDIALRLGDFITRNNDPKGITNPYTFFLDSLNNSLESAGYSASCEYILGALLDLVRTLLAEWVSNSGDLIDAAYWCPIIPKESIHFNLSDYLSGQLEVDSVYWDRERDVLTECQIAVQRSIVTQTKGTTELPCSTQMIALLLLSYPALHVQEQQSVEVAAQDTERDVEIRIRPVIAPQNLYLSLSVRAGCETASLRIAGANNELRFEWESWINAAMNLVKSHNQLAKAAADRREKIKFTGPLDLIKSVDLSRPMCTLHHNDQDDVLLQLPGKLHVWTAWPIFDVRFCRFELRQWMDACGSLPDGWHEAENEYNRRKIAAMETLTRIAGWNSI